MSTDTVIETDIEVLVGDMPEVPCDHENHWWRHDPGPAIAYLSFQCLNCPHNSFGARCTWFVSGVKANKLIKCIECGDTRPALETSTIVSYIKKED